MSDCIYTNIGAIGDKTSFLSYNHVTFTCPFGFTLNEQLYGNTAHRNILLDRENKTFIYHESLNLNLYLGES